MTPVLISVQKSTSKKLAKSAEKSDVKDFYDFSYFQKVPEPCSPKGFRTNVLRRGLVIRRRTLRTFSRPTHHEPAWLSGLKTILEKLYFLIFKDFKDFLPNEIRAFSLRKGYEFRKVDYHEP